MILDRNSADNFNSWLETARTKGGFILVNKDKHWTSFDVIAKLRNLIKIKKIGHAGTLDPLAEGLLIICCGKATKRMTEFQDLPKEYEAVIKLGATTKTDDSEADEENLKETAHISNNEIETALNKFTGKISQIPPNYSAKKIKGKRAYKLARKNVDFELSAKEVEIYSLNLHHIDMPFIKMTVKCSKGTYIRSLARDIGEELKTGGYLYSLIRTGIGDYSVKDALTIEKITELIRNN